VSFFAQRSDRRWLWLGKPTQHAKGARLVKCWFRVLAWAGKESMQPSTHQFGEQQAHSELVQRLRTPHEAAISSDNVQVKGSPVS
jgi:hypothetical protein